jgi:hypothetical protein
MIQLDLDTGEQVMAKRPKRTYFPIKIPINTLSGGVGRQAPSKRLPTEAEDLINVFCTTERSIDKRNGFKSIKNYVKLDIGDYTQSDMWWYWYSAGENREYLIGINKEFQSLDDIVDPGEDYDSKFLCVYKISDSEIVPQIVDDNIPEECIAYLTYGLKSAKESFRAASVGSSVLVLNNDVKAGFTSDGTDDKMFGLDGIKTEETDIKGRKITYLTAVGVDPQGQAEYWNQYTDYVWGQTAIDQNYPVYAGGTSQNNSTPNSNPPNENDTLGESNEAVPGQYFIYRVRDLLDSPSSLPGPQGAEQGISPGKSVQDSITERDQEASGSWERDFDDKEDTNNLDADVNAQEVVRFSKYIPVEDYVYPDITKLYLGQAVTAWSELKFPPDDNDLTAYNGIPQVQETLQALYPNSSAIEGKGNIDGFGKIYYLSQNYLTSTPGWYRVISNTVTPYFQKVRTPDEMGVIDQKRMPMQIFLDEDENEWSIRMVDWEPRTSGTEKSNKGPSFFRNSDGTAKQTEIKAISFYRDRLFLATDDILVSSKLGQFDNFFLDDPANITFRDPIDLAVSSNVYTPITFLQPFKDFLFLGTAGDTQYELMGSENQISPLTAEIAPTSFFPMTADIEPLVMNNNLFFFSKGRLFIYFAASETSTQQAFELSRHAPEYLPDNYWDSAVSTAHNTIFVVGGDQPSNEIFCYRNQIAGEQVVQNAFFKFETSGEVESINASGDNLFAVIRTIDGEGNPCLQLQVMSLLPDKLTLPRIDRQLELVPENVTFDSASNQTIFTIPESIGAFDVGIISSGVGEGSILELTLQEGTTEFATYAAEGNYLGMTKIILGTKFDSKITMSDIYVRDESNNIVPGTLNLRYALLRHRNTGTYNVEVSRKQRTEKTYLFFPTGTDNSETTTDGLVFEEDGVFKFPLMGFNTDLSISVTSDDPSPLNITNIEFTGKFKRVPHYLTS